MKDNEVITLQLGNYANFIGTHWWNIQTGEFIYNREEAESDSTRINHDVLFREGQCTKGRSTFTPRVILVDAKDAFANMDITHCLYRSGPVDHDSHFPTWSREIRFNEEKGNIHRNEFLKSIYDTFTTVENSAEEATPIGKRRYNLDNSVFSWVDFHKPLYHPKSLCIAQCSNAFPAEQSSIFDDFEERFRWFAEDCNFLQGFQLIADAFSSVLSCNLVFNFLRDEFPKKSCICFPVFPPVSSPLTTADYFAFLYQNARDISSFCEDASCSSVLTLPLSTVTSVFERNPFKHSHCGLPHVNYDPINRYHTSAILAAALDTMSTQWRQVEDPDTIADICSGANYNLGSVNFSMPFVCGNSGSSSFGNYLRDLLSSQKDLPLYSISPHVTSLSLDSNSNPQKSSSSFEVFRFCLRGTRSLKIHDSDGSHDGSFANCDSFAEALYEFYRRKITGRFGLATAQQPVPTLAPFPNIFDAVIGQNGCHVTRTANEIVESVPSLSRMDVSAHAGNFVSTLREYFAKVPRNFSRTVDADTVVEALNSLQSITDRYRSGFSDEDSDSD